MSAEGVRERAAGAGTIRVQRVDITTVRVDAVVNAANRSLAGGGGVDGAIHRAAGVRELQEELHRLHPQGCETGSAVGTGPHGLDRYGVRLLIHAVGPRWSQGRAAECDRLLAGAVDAALRLAAEAGCRAVALPSISTGVYGFPVDRAAPIALRAAAAALCEPDTPLREILFALFSDGDLAVYRRALADLTLPD